MEIRDLLLEERAGTPVRSSRYQDRNEEESFRLGANRHNAARLEKVVHVLKDGDRYDIIQGDSFALFDAAEDFAADTDNLRPFTGAGAAQWQWSSARCVDNLIITQISSRRYRNALFTTAVIHCC